MAATHIRNGPHGKSLSKHSPGERERAVRASQSRPEGRSSSHEAEGTGEGIRIDARIRDRRRDTPYRLARYGATWKADHAAVHDRAESEHRRDARLGAADDGADWKAQQARSRH